MPDDSQVFFIFSKDDCDLLLTSIYFFHTFSAHAAPSWPTSQGPTSTEIVKITSKYVILSNERQHYWPVFRRAWFSPPTSPDQVLEPAGVKIFRIPSPIFFANIEFLKDKIMEAVRTTHSLPIVSENRCE